VVGLSTNSLGILSEAAHSGLDLVAAGVTLFAVRLSAMPPDARHPYGHGKVENLSALAETLLLLATCVWIVYEAVDRLFFHPQVVEASLWGVGVMVVSIAVDFTRSRMLMAAAKKHRSQALEADALHFSTDIWSSLVVLAGLGALALSKFIDPASVLAPLIPWLERSDALAALAVSGIVVHVSWRLGKQAIDVLLDGGVQDDIEAIEAAVAVVPGVVGVRRVRVRQSGPESFVDMRLDIPDSLDALEVHEVTQLARQATQHILPGADVLVELLPQADPAIGALERIQEIAATRFGLGVHDIEIRQSTRVLAPHPGLHTGMRAGLHVDLHAEVPGSLSIAQAHERITEMERAIEAEVENVASVLTHIEPEDAEPHEPQPDASGVDLGERVRGVVHKTAGECGMHKLTLHRAGGRVCVSFHCRVPKDTPVRRAHDLTVSLENALRGSLPEISRVTIHVEPEGPAPLSEP
jgi:cation diffusion facilitator family transporter